MDSPGGDAESGGYGDENRAFLQAFLARGTMTFKESKSILAAIFTAGGTQTAAENVTEDDFLAFVAAAQEALSPFDIEIQSAQHQVSKNRVYAIVNSTSDLLSQGATIRNPEEIAYIKRVIDAMFDTYNTPKREIMGVTSMQALESKVRKGTGRPSVGDEAASTQIVDKGVTSQQAEKVLQDMVVEGWFERSKEGWFTLSPRALMELKNWLLEAYNDPADDPEEWQRIKMCIACKEIVTVGQRCPNEECTARLHDICQSDYWKSTPGGVNNKKCPKCETEWTGRNWVGEKAETTTERYQKGRRRPSGKQRQEQQVEQKEEEDEEENAEGEEE